MLSKFITYIRKLLPHFFLNCLVRKQEKFVFQANYIFDFKIIVVKPLIIYVYK